MRWDDRRTNARNVLDVDLNRMCSMHYSNNYDIPPTRSFDSAAACVTTHRLTDLSKTANCAELCHLACGVSDVEP